MESCNKLVCMAAAALATSFGGTYAADEGRTVQQPEASVPKTPEEAKQKWEASVPKNWVTEPCIAAAWDKILSSRRMYNADLSGFDEATGKVDVYVGPQLLVLLPRYINLISSDYGKGTPGAGAVLAFPIEDLVRIANPKRKFAKHPDSRVGSKVLLKLNCVMDQPWPKGKEPWTWDRNATIRAALNIRPGEATPHEIIQRNLNAQGLVEYKISGRAQTAYLPVDKSLRTLHGGVLSIACPRQYSTTATKEPPDWSGWRCQIPIELQKGGGGAEFSLYYLPYWREIHNGLLKIMTQAVKDGRQNAR